MTSKAIPKKVSVNYKVNAFLFGRFRSVVKRRNRTQMYYIERCMRDVVDSEKKSRPSD